ncbi:MAG: hypothetical protein AAFV88_11890 [Planctomycetota bacterium]
MQDPSKFSHLSRILTRPDILRDPASFFDVYQTPIRKFFSCLCRDSNEADEQFQEFAVKFLSGAFDNFNPERGRFRDYLKTSLRNQVRRQAAKNAGLVAAGTEELLQNEADPAVEQPVDVAMKAFDEVEGEHIRQLVEADMLDEERAGKNQFHSLLRFAISYQQQLTDPESNSASRRVPVSAVIEFVKESFGETISRDTAKQRMSRAKSAFATKMILEIGTRIGDASISAVGQAASELGLAPFVGKELQRRKEAGES